MLRTHAILSAVAAVAFLGACSSDSVASERGPVKVVENGRGLGHRADCRQGNP